MKFKGHGKINICGFEYKKNIADSRRGGGGSEHPPKKPVPAPGNYVSPRRGIRFVLHAVSDLSLSLSRLLNI